MTNPNYELISAYLEDHETLWQIIDEYEPCLPLMDLSMELINEDNYYGYDFTGEKQVYQLFFTGSSNYFPGIYCTGTNKLDECPIFIFDLPVPNIEYIGNFKLYMTTVLKDFLKKKVKNKHNKYQSEAEEALNELDIFSDKVKYKKYKLKSKSE